MKILHLANTSTEWELETEPAQSIDKVLHAHPVFSQLQYLSSLYADEEDGVLVTHFPPKRTGNMHLMDESHYPYTTLETWGWSKAAKKWAGAHGIAYNPPPLHVVKEVSSKVFSFTHSPTLPGAKLLQTENELKTWAKEGPFPKVIKTPFGMSGRGHYFLESKQSALPSKLQFPLIGEPWVNRLLDFSTQWSIARDQTISFFGATTMKNSPKGKYEKTHVGNEDKLFGPYKRFLMEHLDVVKLTLKQIAEKGYFGEVGIDAMVYEHPVTRAECLHPITEINPRKTMGWVALKLKKKWNVSALSLHYVSGNEEGLLPREVLFSDGKIFSFRKQLKADIVK